MSIFTRLALRSLRQHRVRAAGAGVGIILSSCLLSTAALSAVAAVQMLGGAVTSETGPLNMPFKVVVSIVGLVVLLAGSALVYNSFSISTAERIAQFGLLNSLGASKKQIRRCVAAEALLLCVICIPLGEVMGACFALIVSNNVLTEIQNAFPTLVQQPHLDVLLVCVALVAVAAMVFAMVLASAWIPARRATRLPAIEAIRQQGTQTTSARRKQKRMGRPAWGARAAERLCGTPGLIAHRMLSYSKTRGRSAVLSLALSCALIVVSAYASDVFGIATSPSGHQGSGDVEVCVDANGPNLPDAHAIANALTNIDDVTKVSWSQDLSTQCTIDATHIQAPANNTDALSNIGIAMVENGKAEFFAHTIFVDDSSWKWLCAQADVNPVHTSDAAHPSGILLNSYATSQSGAWQNVAPFATPGKLEVTAPYFDPEEENGESGKDAPGTPYSIDVIGLVDETLPTLPYFADIVLFVPARYAPNAFAAWAHPDTPSIEFVIFEDGSAKTAEKIGNRVPMALDPLLPADTDISRVTNRAALREQDELKNQIASTVMKSAAGLCCLISVTNVVSVVSASILMQRRSFSILQSLGMSKRQLLGVLGYECASYSMRGLALGLGVSVCCCFALYRVFLYSLIGVAFSLPWSAIGLALIACVATLLFTCGYALLRTRRASPIEQLRMMES